MKSEKWYVRRLAAYCDSNYAEYEDDMEFFPDPAVNQWLFDIPSLKERIELTCDDKGKISKLTYPRA